MEQNKGADLGGAPIGKLLLSLAIPAITAQLVNMLYSIVDRIYIGHIPDAGATALTGVGVAFPILMILAAFASLVGMGGAPRAAICMGRGDEEGAKRILGNCFVSLLAISLFLTVFFLVFGEPILILFGASEQTLPYALSYMSIYVLGTAFVQMALGLNAFITTQGFAQVAMRTVLIGAVVNIILDPIFIFVFGLGVRGAALASVLSQGLSSAWVLRFLTGSKTRLRIERRNLRVSAKVMLPVLALGVSPFIMQSTESLVNVSLNTSLQRYGGDLAVGAMTILASSMQVLSLPLLGLSQGAQPIISYNYGAKKNDRVAQALRLLLIASLAYAVVFWAGVMTVPQLATRVFNSDPDLIQITSWAMRIYMAAAFMMGAQIACQQTFIAVGQAKVSLFLALLRKVILLVPLIYLLPALLTDKVFAVFLAEPVADFLATTCTVVIFSIRFPKILAANRQKPDAEV